VIGLVGFERNVTKVAVGDLGDTASDEVIQVKRDRSIGYCFVDMVVGTNDVQTLPFKLGLNIGIEIVASRKTTDENHVFTANGLCAIFL